MEVKSYQSNTDTIIDEFNRKRDEVQKSKSEIGRNEELSDIEPHLEEKLFGKKSPLTKQVESYSSLNIHEKSGGESGIKEHNKSRRVIFLDL